MSASAPRPLEGLLVISIEQALAAPLCSGRLAEMGARVVKVERAEGDFARGYDAAAKGQSSYFAWTNRGKESLVLDFKDAEDAALLRRLIAKADIRWAKEKLSDAQTAFSYLPTNISVGEASHRQPLVSLQRPTLIRSGINYIKLNSTTAHQTP